MTSPNEQDNSPNEPTRRLKLLIAYDGATFRGWQSQAHAETIQDRVENAFAAVAHWKIRVHGAGRTDSGVHALAQCAHADVPAGGLAPVTWLNALNASLPAQIRVIGCRFVPESFHARFSARGKIYRYRIATTPVLLPFEVGRAWHVTSPLDDELLRASARLFAGTHDFAGFAANRGSAPASTTRTIYSVKVRRTSAVTVIEFDGDGFLYKMVRLLVGSIIRCATGKETLDAIQRRLTAGADNDRARLVAPAAGLTLVRLRY